MSFSSLGWSSAAARAWEVLPVAAPAAGGGATASERAAVGTAAGAATRAADAAAGAATDSRSPFSTRLAPSSH
eukprot:CAMPEP_0170499526 /NCGR_PEP_ID=MMETSP0208-20121228/31720_1 /TAXON_ID=197538 /ORGANISM="Strombidium inclinatum, Strain S3" /LENGTH=72 /DNA_ID=CAMNT_0010777125 /DNA_START=361 /DNA_END=580 /DNA_ORIENTATION=+